MDNEVSTLSSPLVSHAEMEKGNRGRGKKKRWDETRQETEEKEK